MTNSAKNIALTGIPAISGMSLLNGTPKLDTYHQPLVVAQHSASMNSSAAKNAIRLRAQRSTAGDTSTVATAAIAAPTAANSPKWCTHLVGVNINTNTVANRIPINRHTGPRATPGTRLRRNMMKIDTNSDSAVMRNPNRRDSDPSTVG